MSVHGSILFNMEKNGRDLSFLDVLVIKDNEIILIAKTQAHVNIYTLDIDILLIQSKT